MSTDAAPVSEEQVDIATMLATLTAAAKTSEEPVLLAAGTFAAYPTRDGGLHLVMTVEDGPFAQPEPHRANLSGNLLRALIAFTGGSKGGAVRALFGSRGK